MNTTLVGFGLRDVLALSEKLVASDDSGQEAHPFTFLGEAQPAFML